MDLRWVVVLILALVIVFGLAAYAGLLLGRLQRQRRQRRRVLAARNERIAVSIRTISMAMVQGQCNLSEGAIRLVMLLEALQLPVPVRQQDYPGIYALYDKVKEMPTHEARRQRPRTEIMKLDLRRARYEAELEQHVLTDARRLQVLAPFG